MEVEYGKAWLERSHRHFDHQIVKRWEHRTADVMTPLKRWEVCKAHID